jgi:hypothetical protein
MITVGFKKLIGKKTKKDQETLFPSVIILDGAKNINLTSLLISNRSDTRSSGHSHVEQPLTAELYANLHSHEISRAITAIPFLVRI